SVGCSPRSPRPMRRALPPWGWTGRGTVGTRKYPLDPSLARYWNVVRFWSHLVKDRYFPPLRSEEHTSELQSRFEIVCRLLLEIKNALTGYSIISIGAGSLV